MRFLLRSSLVPIAALLTVCASAADLQTVYNKIDAGAAGFKGLTADIKRVAHMDVISEDDVEAGKIAVKRGKGRDVQMRIDFQTPNEKQVAFSGTRADIYYPKTNTDEQYDLGKHKDMVDQFLLLGFGTSSQDLRAKYNIKLLGAEAIGGQPTTHIELTPKETDMAQTFPKVELWISDSTGMALQQKLYEKGGKDYQLAVYSNMKLRPDITEAEVKPNIPKNAHKTSPLK